MTSPRRPVVLWWVTVTTLALVLGVVASVPSIRAVLSAPLVVADGAATGDAAYVLAGGVAFEERLAAASDLYFMRRVPLIIIKRDDSQSAYNFAAHASWTRTQWALDFLRWKGVPDANVLVVDLPQITSFGTLNEARSLVTVLPPAVVRLVLVTSAAHTRRALLAFRRSLPATVALTPYAATSVDTSVEFWRPLWVEYVKLLVYAVMA